MSEASRWEKLAAFVTASKWIVKAHTAKDERAFCNIADALLAAIAEGQGREELLLDGSCEFCGFAPAHRIEICDDCHKALMDKPAPKYAENELIKPAAPAQGPDMPACRHGCGEYRDEPGPWHQRGCIRYRETPWDGVDRRKAQGNGEVPPLKDLTEAFHVMRRATMQGHTAHWDPTGSYGAGCPECKRASDLREKAEHLWHDAKMRFLVRPALDLEAVRDKLSLRLVSIYGTGADTKQYRGVNATDVIIALIREALEKKGEGKHGD